MCFRCFALFAALIAGLALSGCDEPYKGPARVINLGLHADSTTGAIIVSGHDNLWDIAKRYRLPIRDIIDLNGLEPPYALKDGQRLKLPAPVDYRARSGDTLQNVASMFGVSVSQLVTVNKISAPYRLRPGLNLRIPSVMREQKQIPAPQRQSIVQNQKPSYPAAQASHFGEIRKGGERQVERQILQPPSSFIWPVRGVIISGYGPKEDGLYNEGVNIAAPRGTPVAAAADGVVAYVGNDLKSYGNLVLVRHGGGAMTAYAHLASLRAKKGMTVRRGDIIGTVGSTGAVPSSQLHFEIRHGSKTCDPRQYLRS